MSNQGNEVLGAHLGIDKSKSKNEKKSRIKVNLKKWFDDGNILPLSTIDNVLHEDDNDHDHNDDNDVNHDNDNDVNDVNHDNDNTKTKIEKEKEKSSNQIYLKKWTDNGNTIPICINQGCNNTVSIRHWSSQGDPSLKTECSRCADARKKNKEIPGVTFHKKNIVKIRMEYWDLYALWIKIDMPNFQAIYITWTISMETTIITN